MLELLKAAGIGGAALATIAVLGLGWLMVKAVLQAWEALLERMKGVATAAVGEHAASCPAKAELEKAEAFRREVREALTGIRDSVSTMSESIERGLNRVHQRIDQHLNAEIEDARRSRAGGDDT